MFVFIFILAVVLQSAPATAQETPPWIQKEIGIPDPIPVGFNQCIRVLWSKRAKHDRRISVWRPPFSRKDIVALNAIKTRGLGKLELCNEAPT